MPQETITWICLPNGAQDGSARLTALACPQLTPDGDHTALHDFALAAWPAMLQTATFQLRCGDQTLPLAVDPTGAPPASQSQRAQLWEALFPPAQLVRAGEREQVSGVFGSYPAARLQAELRTAYAQAVPLGRANRLRAVEQQASRARSSRRAVLEGSVEDLVQQLMEVETTAQPNEAPSDLDSVVRRLVDLALEPQRLAVAGSAPAFRAIVPDDGSANSALAQFRLFHRQSALAPTRDALLRRAKMPAPQTDFHQRLTLLSEYPALQRRLGLLVDLTCDFEPLLAAAASAGAGGAGVPVSLLVQFSGLPAPSGPAQPATACRIEGPARFSAMPRSEAWIDGLLNLSLTDPLSGEPVFSLVDFDLDGAGLQWLDLVGRAEADRAATDTAPLRSIGLSLMQADYARALFASATGHERLHGIAGEDGALVQRPFAAEDLVRGYRVDIQDFATDAWHSLHARQGEYRVAGIAAPLTIEDEGCISPTMTQPQRSDAAIQRAAQDAEQPNFVAESLFVWDGWSLSAPRPGGALASAAPVTDAAAVATAGAPLHVTFTARPGSLPRLRFGRAYRLRVRTTDLAGNGPDLASAAPLASPSGPPTVLPSATEGWTFRRFEAIGSPVTARLGSNAEKQPLDALVFKQDASDEGAATAAACRLTPPLVSQIMAEWSGAFDASLAERRFADGFAMANGSPPGSDERRHAQAEHSGGLPDPFAAGLAIQNCPGVPQGKVARFDGATLQLSDLPALTEGLGATAQSLLLIDFAPAPAWPRIDGIEAQLASGAHGQAPDWHPASRTLTLFLAPGASADLLISCRPNQFDLPRLALLDWAAAATDGAPSSATLDQLACLGLLEMVTPARRLRLIHAVQQPLRAPRMESLEAPERLFGETAAYLACLGTYEPASSGRLELHARLTDRVDSGAGPSPQPIDHHELVLSFNPEARPQDLPAGVTVNGLLGQVQLHAPSLKAESAELRRGVGRIASALSGLVAAAFAARPPNLPLRKQAMAFQGRSAVLSALARREPFQLHWAALASEAAFQADMATFFFFNENDGLDPVPPGGRPLGSGTTPQVARAAERVQTAALQVAEQAGGLLAKLQRNGPLHRLDDTRHRRVAYELRAISRFADHFEPPADASPDKFFASTSLPFETVIPSSSRPAPPQIDAVQLTFHWQRSPVSDQGQQTIERRCGLRVMLRRPWFSSGDGELLAAIIQLQGLPKGSARPAAQTRWARDPTRVSAALPAALDVNAFRAPAAVLRGLEVVAPESADGVFATAVGYPVSYDADGRCFCDIDFDTAAHHVPFIQLALARLQPASIPGVELSELVLCAPVPFLPTRQIVAIRQSDFRLEVIVTGAIHTSSSPLEEAGGINESSFRATLQRRLAGTVDDLGWQAAPELGSVLIRPVLQGQLWSATINFAGNETARLLLEEVMHYATDTDNPDSSGERVVFAEVLSLIA